MMQEHNAEVFNIKNLTMARAFSPDLDRIIKEFTMTIAALSVYAKYKPVARTLVILNTELGVLNSYKNDCESIISNKGKVAPETKHE